MPVAEPGPAPQPSHSKTLFGRLPSPEVEVLKEVQGDKLVSLHSPDLDVKFADLKFLVDISLFA